MSRVVFISHYGSLYGANQSLLTFIEHSTMSKADMIVIVPELGAFTDKLTEIGVQFIHQLFSPNIYRAHQGLFRRHWNGVKKLRWLFKLYIILKKLKPVLIYSNSSILYYGFFLSKLLGIPHIWHLREFGALDFKIYPDFGLNFQRYLLSKNTFNIAISRSISKYYKLNEHNSKIIYNGVSTSAEFAETYKEKSFDKPLTFGVVGAIMPYKGQLQIVEAFHQFLVTKGVKENTLYLIGLSVGDYVDEISAYIKNNNLEKNIIIIGHVKERAQIYRKFDVLINGAKNEGFGRTTVEAMSYGIVPIGYNHSGITETIAHKVNGILFDSFDILPAILIHIDQNRAALQALQKNIKANFNPDFLTENYCAKLDHIINKNIKSLILQGT